jgi:hypothetical protein
MAISDSNCSDPQRWLRSFASGFAEGPSLLEHLEMNLPNDVVEPFDYRGISRNIELLLLTTTGMKSISLSMSDCQLVSKDSISNHAATLEYTTCSR